MTSWFRPSVWGGAIFLGGVMFGAAGVFTYEQLNPSPAITHAQDFRRRYVTMMEDKLRLTSAQTGQLNAILDTTKSKVDQLHEQYSPELHRIREEQYKAVCSILTPGQIEEYNRLRAARQAAARKSSH